MSFKSLKSYGNQYFLSKVPVNAIVATPTPIQPTPTSAPPPTPIFNYGFNSSLTYDEIGQRDDAINRGAILDNTVFKKGTGSAKFTGANTPSYIQTPSFPILANTGLTFSTWFKVPAGTLNGFNPIFSNNNAGSPTFIFGGDYQNANCMFFYSTNSGNVGLINVFYTTPVFDNTWHHTIITISSDNTIMKWFLDGVQITYSNRQPGTNPQIFPQNKEFQMGSASAFTGSYNIDNFVFYNRELTVSEAVQLYNAQKPHRHQHILQHNISNFRWMRYEDQILQMVSKCPKLRYMRTESEYPQQVLLLQHKMFIVILHRCQL